ncbi:MAG: hypothetical protein IKK94_03865 [Clostridia bacterium]|nr:hypothetical protein [Clostridia bacterium]
MKVKFANGAVKECTAPTEQKVFKTVGGETVGVGWMLILRLVGNITSNEFDSIVNSDGVSSLEFIKDGEGGAEVSLFKLEGYSKITSSTIRHSEDTSATYVEIQMSKGV